MRIFSLGDSAATIEFGNEISLVLNERAVALADTLSADPFPGLTDVVPAYSSVTLFYDPITVRKELPDHTTAFAYVKDIAENAIENLTAVSAGQKRPVEVPIQIMSDASSDFSLLCEFSALERDEVIDIFLAGTYRVYMLGFLPGFAYMGDVDERIAAPRLRTPRTKVPKGSVGIAGKQTGIYPLESPGGWNIIGRTKLELFNPDASSPCLLKPGDEVKFVLRSEI